MVVKEAIVIGSAVPLLTGLVSGAKRKEWRNLLLSGVIAGGISAIVMSYAIGQFRVPIPVRKEIKPKVERPIFPASPVSVNKFYEEPISEFYLNGPGEHIYVD